MKIFHIIFLLALATILGSSFLYARLDRRRTGAGSSAGIASKGAWMDSPIFDAGRKMVFTIHFQKGGK